jgi:ribonuclease T2
MGPGAIRLLLILCFAASSARAADFDYYVLSLSWSPEYCNTSGGRDPQQCSPGRRLGFVLHGLWPQFDKGYPSNCGSGKMPAAVKARYPGLYPNEKLFEHEWSKHGTCSGLSPDRYLSLTQRLRQSVVVPEVFRAPAKPVRMTTAQFKRAFVIANAGLQESSIAVNCTGSGRFLREVFVCFTKDGKATACSREVQSRAAQSCGRADFLVRNVR